MTALPTAATRNPASTVLTGGKDLIASDLGRELKQLKRLEHDLERLVDAFEHKHHHHPHHHGHHHKPPHPHPGPGPQPGPGPVPQPDAGSVKLFPMPDSGPQPIVDAINKAQKTVDLSVYMMTDPKVIDALKQAAGRGVQVRVMLEPHPIGSNGTGAYDALAAQLQAAGIQVEPTPPKFDGNYNVDHAKFMVIDQKETLFGTGNLVKSGLGDSTSFANRDFWVDDTRGETAKEAEELFNDDWLRQDTSGIDFKNLVVTPENANARILSFIDGAKSKLLVYNQELHDPTIVQHLIAAKQRGVDVQVLVAAPHGQDGNKPALDQLAAAGIPAHELTKYYLHAKAMVADNQAFIGSQNFSSGGLQNNRELGEIVDDPAIVQQLTQTFLNDAATTTTPPPAPPPAA